VDFRFCLPSWLLRLGLEAGHYVPGGPVLQGDGIDRWLAEARAPFSQPVRGGSPIPAPPFQLFALHYLEDIVVETKHPRWQMHEYARVALGDREVWLAKDSDNDGVQTISVDLEEPGAWLPEIPVPRRREPVQVDDRSDARHLDVSIRYRNPAGERVEVDFRAPRPPRATPLRNGSTFEHSQAVLAAVLDIPAQQLTGVRCSVRFDGRERRLDRAFGLLPIKVLLRQTQAGFVEASMRLSPEDGAVAVQRPIPGTRWGTRGSETWSLVRTRADEQVTTADNGITTTTSTWRDGGLAHAWIAETTGGRDLVELRLSAPLPDLSRPFDGLVVRRFALMMSTGAHGAGEVRCRRQGDEALVDVVPQAPFWFARRPLRTRVRLVRGSVDVRSERIGAATLAG